MKSIKPWIASIAFLGILLTVLFPPFYLHAQGKTFGLGFGFILTGPFNSRYSDIARIDFEVLLTIWVGIILFCMFLNQLPGGYFSRIIDFIRLQHHNTSNKRKKIILLAVTVLVIAMLAIASIFIQDKPALDTSGLKPLSFKGSLPKIW